MKATFAGLYGATAGEITAEEYAKATELVASKFSTDAWLTRVP
jgi:lipoate-protein ligase A